MTPQQLMLSKVKQSDLFTRDGLEKQTGITASQWNIYCIKELFDNAIDACEIAGISPVIQLSITKDEDSTIRLLIKDNAGGISKEQLLQIIDLSTYTSTKYYYKRPTRGFQGNALLTILAIPFVLDLPTASVRICTQGRTYNIKLVEDRISQSFRFELHEAEAKANQNESEKTEKGTEITLRLKMLPNFSSWNNTPWDNAADYKTFILNYGIFNPHIQLKCNILGEEFNIAPMGTLDSFKSGDKESVHWYSVNDFEELIYAYIRAKKDVSIKNFSLGFKGISNSTSADDILKGISCKYVADFESKPGEIPLLYHNLKALTKPPKPQILGALSRDRMYEALNSATGEKRYKPYYNTKEYNGKIVPYVIEVAAGEFTQPMRCVGLNHAPVYRLSNELHDILRICDVSLSDRVYIIIHISCPNIEFSNYGKSEFNIMPFKEDLLEGLKHVLKPYIIERKRRRRELYKNQKESDEYNQHLLADIKNRKKLRITEVFLDTLDEALAKASDNGLHMPTARTVYYKHRPLIQKYELSIKQDYHRKLLEKEEMRRGKLLANREARGWILHPGEKEATPLDTKFANAYDPPADKFNKVIYIEKRGLGDLMAQTKMHDKYDAVIIGGQGQSSWDARYLLFKIIEKYPDIPIFCLHDCDIYGMQIKQSLEKEHYLHGVSVEVIDMGLTVKEAREKEYAVETVIYKREPSYESVSGVITEEEFNWLKGERGVGKRVELDIFSPGEFILWFESKLSEFGVKGKVLPEDRVLKRKADEHINKVISDGEIDLWDYTTVKDIEDIFRSIVNEEDAIKEIKEELSPDIEDLRDDVKDKLVENPVENWEHFTKEYVDRNLEKDSTVDCIEKIIENNTDSKKLSVLKKGIQWIKDEISKITKNGEVPSAC
jgi:DNA topoisomerase VI subunit B